MNLPKIIVHPRRISRVVVTEGDIRFSICFVVGFAIVFSVFFLGTYFAESYPPPVQELEAWVEAWGEFTILPVLKVPLEQYRLFLAVSMTPMVLAAWILMAGSARLWSILFRGRVTYEQYLKLFAHSFFPFWALGHLLDVIYSYVLADFVLAALQMSYGLLVRQIVMLFPFATWNGTLLLGGTYNIIAIHENEGFSLVGAVLCGLTAFVWPIVLVIFIIR